MLILLHPLNEEIYEITTLSTYTYVRTWFFKCKQDTSAFLLIFQIIVELIL